MQECEIGSAIISDHYNAAMYNADQCSLAGDDQNLKQIVIGRACKVTGCNPNFSWNQIILFAGAPIDNSEVVPGKIGSGGSGIVP